MTTAGRTSTTAAMAGVLILVVIVVLALLVIIGVSRCSRRRGRGWAHGKTRESRLVATVRMLVRCVHWYSKLLLLLLLLLSALRELECIHLLWGDTAHRGTGLKRGHLAQLLGLQQPHVNVLLVCRSNLLLLLLEQLDLLLDGQLFHHQRGELRWTSPMSNMELAATRALRPRLTLLIHDPR